MIRYLQICTYSIAIGLRTVFFLLRSLMLIYRDIMTWYNIYLSLVLIFLVLVSLVLYHLHELIGLKPKETTYSGLIMILRIMVIIFSDLCILFTSIHLIYFLMIHVKPLLRRFERLFSIDVTPNDIHHKPHNLYNGTRMTILFSSLLGFVWIICNIPFLVVNLLILSSTNNDMVRYYSRIIDDALLVMIIPISISWFFNILLCETLRQEILTKLKLCWMEFEIFYLNHSQPVQKQSSK